MTDRTSFTTDEARTIGAEIGIDWETAPFDVEQFGWGWTSSSSTGSTTPRPT
jgi:hypothetical protein